MPRFNFSTAVTLSGDSLSGTADPQLNTASVFGNLSMERNAVVTSIQDLGANTPAIVGQSTIVFGMSTLSGSGALITGSGATGGTTHLEGRVTSSTTTIPSPTVLEIQAAEYAELEQALSDLRGLDDDEQWKIDDTVYSASVQVAAVLMQNSVPTPSVFTHGSKSVVFNWSAEGNNLYLTVSPSRLDVLVSSSEAIQYRAELAHQVQDTERFFLAMGSAHIGRIPVLEFKARASGTSDY